MSNPRQSPNWDGVHENSILNLIIELANQETVILDLLANSMLKFNWLSASGCGLTFRDLSGEKSTRA